MAQVELAKVSKIFPGGVKAVDSVNLTVADAEFVVLVGPSGCGKSTTLRMIAGLEDISDGQIRIGDRIVNDVSPKDRDIAMVFQNYALYPHMSVYRNMAFGLKLRGVPGPQVHQRVMGAAKLLELEPLLDRKPGALSGGQRQRVAVGRAIVREPAAFLFDEPLSNLDAQLRVAMRGELKRLHRRLGTTTVYVTHDQEEAMTLGERIVVMKEGKVQQADAPLRTYNEPVNRFVAGFIGTPPMNFIDGVLRMADGEPVFEEGRLDEAGELALPGTGFRIPVPGRLRRRLSGWTGRHVVLGIRPEHFRLSPADCDGQGASVDVELTVIEPLGPVTDVYMDLPLHDRVVARLEAGDGLEAGARVTMYVDLRRIHFFEPGETGMNLSLLNEPAHAHA